MIFKFSKKHLLAQKKKENANRKYYLLLAFVEVFFYIGGLYEIFKWYDFLIIFIFTIIAIWYVIRTRSKRILKLQSYLIELSENHISDKLNDKYIKHIHFSMIDEFLVDEDILVLRLKAPESGKLLFDVRVDDRERLLTELSKKLVS